jgi:hypothetical protein
LDDLLAKFKLPPEPPKTEWKPPINEIFGLSQVAYPEDSQFAAIGKPVMNSHDLARVIELPRRGAPDLEALAGLLTARLGKGDVSCRCAEFKRRCAKRLLPVQAWALKEMVDCNGLLGPIGVGHGKTLLDLLAAMVMPSCRVAVLLIPPNLRQQLLEIDWEFYSQHWHLPNLANGRWHVPGRPFVHVVAFSELSGAKSTDLLERLNPDLVIVDEAHHVRRREAARTKRFLRYLSGRPNTRLCAWSGTLTSKSVKDYAHLSNFALRDGSPTPLHWPTVEEWAGAIDPSDFPSPIGALSKLCRPGEHLHDGWRRRLRDTAGVVSSPDSASCGASILFSERKVDVPSPVYDKILAIHQSWQRPDGEELVDAISKSRCAREMACGFFYRWRWPRGEPEPVVLKWLAIRKEWHRELREKLKHSREHLDSPLLCTKAAIRHSEGYKGDLPVWDAQYWASWRDVRTTAAPETESVWESDFLVRDAAAWARSNVGIVWYEHDAFGRAVADAAGCPFYGPGKDASRAILDESGSRTIVASIRAHGTGKNLQRFCRNLVANPPSDGATWEQLIGRTHRPGQEADEVTFDVYRHTEDFRLALDKARMLAGYIEHMIGGQKLLNATFLF